MGEQRVTTAGGNADGKPSEKGEAEEVLRTVGCLRGRLIAERAASRNAKEEADQLEKKLIELENRLKGETKSRNRAERRLKSLMKKLESLEIFYVSDESERSGFLEKSEISSTSSVASTSTKEAENQKEETANLHIATIQNIQGPPVKNAVNSRPNDGSRITEKFVQNCPEIAAQNLETAEMSKQTSSSPGKCPGRPESEETLSSVTEADTAKSCASDSNSTQNYQELNTETHSSECGIIKDDTSNGDAEEVEQGENVDNSMAIVAVELPKKEQRIDPVVLDTTVKEVLDALRQAKEKLQTSMERRRMISVG